MSERKCLNKYQNPERQYKIKRIDKKRIQKFSSTRFMIPFDFFCKKCSFLFKQGKKVNALKEKVSVEIYLQIKIFRFYIKCPKCKKGVSLKTDPKNSCYRLELNCQKFL